MTSRYFFFAIFDIHLPLCHTKMAKSQYKKSTLSYLDGLLRPSQKREVIYEQPLNFTTISENWNYPSFIPQKRAPFYNLMKILFPFYPARLIKFRFKTL